MNTERAEQLIRDLDNIADSAKVTDVLTMLLRRYGLSGKSAANIMFEHHNKHQELVSYILNHKE